VAPVAPAWQPHSLRVLAFVAPDGAVYVYDLSDCRQLLHKHPVRDVPTRLQWSTDGKLLLVVAPHAISVYDLNGRVVGQDDPSGGTRDLDATFIGATHQVAVLRNGGDVFLLQDARQLFHASGLLRQVVSSPDGGWLLLGWPAADQWVFVRVQAPHRIRAFSGITRQFGGGSFPVVSGWIGK
jgi:hypothetical protein